MISFTRLAAAGSPSPGDLAVALAAEFPPADPDGAQRALAELAGAMRPAAGLPALEQLAHCARVTAACVTAQVRPAAVDELLLDRVLATGAGDPVCWAIACVHGAAQAGIALGIAADVDDHVLVAHQELGLRFVVEPLAPGVPLEADRLPAGELTWRGAHGTALVALDRLLARAVRAGRMHEAVRAADLRLELPLGAATRARLAEERRALAARLN